MIVATTPFIAGHRVVETKGQTFGLVVRSRGFSGNLIAGLRSIGGGEIHEYTSLLEDTRRQALDRLVKNATLMGAQRRRLDAVRQLRAGRHDVRDRRLRHGGRRRARRGRAPAADRIAGRASDDAHRHRSGSSSASSASLMVLGGLSAVARSAGRSGRRAVARRSSAPASSIARRRRAPALPLRGGRPGVRRRSGRAAASRRARSSRASGRPTSVFVDPTTRPPDAGLRRPPDRRAALRRRGSERHGRRRRRANPASVPIARTWASAILGGPIRSPGRPASR